MGDANPFTLENGGFQLRELFGNIEILRYPDSLQVTNPDPLVDFVLSTSRFGLNQDQRVEFSNFIQDEIVSKGGSIRIHKDSGIFIST